MGKSALMMEKGQITDTRLLGEITSLVDDSFCVQGNMQNGRRRFRKAREESDGEVQSYTALISSEREKQITHTTNWNM